MQKIERGESLTLRVPTGASSEVINYLQRLRTQEKRGFSPKLFQLLEIGIREEKRRQQASSNNVKTIQN